MSASDLKLLERKLMREINAREQAEKLLEEKSLALYESNTQLKEVNGKLKTILEEKSNTLFRRELEYKSLVENINDIICKTDLLGTISYVNPIVETILGYEGHEVVGKT
ncbi:MAG: PAS domain S-box protein, partial [Carboxylicivirga sp.]|nr:PAS domain S-box protein [Carboxylicivirga sp.]